MYPQQQTHWQPRTSGILAFAALGLILAIVSVTGITDPPGRVLCGVAAVGLLGFAITALRARPKLAITTDGLALRGPLRTTTLHRADITRIRITEIRRIGRKVRLLEIDSIVAAIATSTCCPRPVRARCCKAASTADSRPSARPAARRHAPPAG